MVVHDLLNWNLFMQRKTNPMTFEASSQIFSFWLIIQAY